MSEHLPERPRIPQGFGSSPRPRSQASSPTQSRQLRQYKVVLLADSVNDLMFIVRTVMELTRFCRAEATHKMWLAHHDGKSVLLVTHLERGELFVEQFASRNVQTTLEPA